MKSILMTTMMGNRFDRQALGDWTACDGAAHRTRQRRFRVGGPPLDDEAPV